MADVSMRILLSAQSGNTFSVISQVAQALGAGGLVGGLAMVAVAADGAALALGTTAVQAAADFQDSMSKVQAYAGYTAQQTQQMGQQILALAPEIGETPKQLADALYMVASAGFKGSQGLTILKYAGETAAAANTDASVVTKDLVASLSALGLSGDDAGQIMDELNATVKNGLMTWDQYGSVVGKLASTASVAGGGAEMMQQNFEDLNASLDVYTNAGVSARQATMWLSADMTLLDGKTQTITKNAAALGLSFDETKFKSMDFAQQLQYLNQVTGGNREELVKLLGGNSTVANSIMFLNGHYQQLSSTLQSVSGSMKNGATTQSMFAVTQQNLNFQIKQLQAGLQSFLITVGQQLLPIVTKVLGLVGGAAVGFLKWFESSGILQTGISILSAVLNKIISIIQAIATWVQHNKLAMEALKDIVIGLAVAFGVILAVGLATVILGIAVLGAAIAVIVGIVMGVIWVVQHWGQIWSTVVDWVKGVWHAFTSWLGERVGDIVGFFVGLWEKAVSIWNSIVDGIKQAIHAGFQWVQDRIHDAITFVVGLFSWLYLHNYYFQHLVDAIRRIISAGVTWLKNAWQTVTNWLHNLWQSIVGIAQTVWSAISGAISSVVTTIWNWLVGVWNTVIGWLSQQWNKLAGFAQTAWNAVTGVFKSVWGDISGALSSLWNNISNWFGNLANQALTWGKNMIQGFINGIKNMLGSVGDAAKSVMNTVASFLGFHSPAKEGPGAEADVWPKNLIKMFAAGMQSQLPLLEASLALVMRPVGNTLSGQGLAPSAVGRGGPSTSYGGHTFNITVSTLPTTNQQQIRQMVDMIEQEIGRRVRSQTPGYSAAGIF